MAYFKTSFGSGVDNSIPKAAFPLGVFNIYMVLLLCRETGISSKKYPSIRMYFWRSFVVCAITQTANVNIAINRTTFLVIYYILFNPTHQLFTFEAKQRCNIHIFWENFAAFKVDKFDDKVHVSSFGRKLLHKVVCGKHGASCG